MIDNNVGRILVNRYRLDELIGSGGMADVYRATDTLDSKIVAVKILKQEFSQKSEFLRRFRNESQAVTSLAHPNIVKIHNVNFDGDEQFIVMEYIDGITLREYMDEKRKVGQKDVVHFCIQILRALQHAHTKGIIHRDIKPQNIMLLADGTIKVMDFGVAKIARDNTTGNGQTVGSVHYLSPEQARGDDIDERSDVYSVGVMAYEMLTGQKPFDADTPVSVAVMHMQTKATLPKDLNPEIPLGLEEIVMKALEKDITTRYKNAIAMIKDFEAFKANNKINFGYLKRESVMANGMNGFNDELNGIVSPKRPTTLGDIDEEDDDDYEYEDDDDYDEDEEVDIEEIDDEPEAKSLFVPILSAVTIVVLIAAVFFVVSLFNDTFGKKGDTGTKQEFIVPDLLGKTFSEAIAEYPNLTIQIDGEPEPSALEPNMIFSQDPPSAKTVKNGTVIKVKVSAGEEQVEVPNVIGQDYRSAQEALTQKGLTYDVKFVANENYQRNVICEMNPPGGTKVEVGAKVTLTISSGTELAEIAVPNFVGEMVENAKNQATYLGISIDDTAAPVESEKPRGTVLSQTPAAGTLVIEGIAIKVTVSSGVAPTNNVTMSFAIPEGYIGSYEFLANMENMVTGSGTFNAEYSTTAQLTLSGSGVKEVVVSLSNKTTGLTAMVGPYTVDFTKKTFESTLADIPGAFESVGERKPAETTAVTTVTDDPDETTRTTRRTTATTRKSGATTTTTGNGDGETTTTTTVTTTATTTTTPDDVVPADNDNDDNNEEE
jgi:serine/threonine-protein kinase